MNSTYQDMILKRASDTQDRHSDLYDHVKSIHPDTLNFVNAPHEEFVDAISRATRNIHLRIVITYLQYGGDRDNVLRAIERILK